jgi:hypothetical protein
MVVLEPEQASPLSMYSEFDGHFAALGTDAFKDKRYNNAPVLLTKFQRDEVTVMLKNTTPSDHGYSNSPFGQHGSWFL